MSSPPLLRTCWKVWKKMSRGIGIVMSAVLLTILWGVAFGLYAIVMKLGNVLRKESVQGWIDISSDRLEFDHQS